MRVSNLNSMDVNGHTKLSVIVESERLGRRELWFSTPAQYSSDLCKTRLDGFLVGLLYPAMQYGEDIHLNGCVSSRLLFNVNNYVIPMLLSFAPSCKPIKVTASQASTEIFSCREVGTGFSGGVDSFNIIYNRHELEPDPNYKINAFVFLNVGSHGSGMTESECEFAQEKFGIRYNHLKAFPDELGLDFIPLNSNLHSFHPWGHLKTCTLTAISGILMLQGRFRRYYYATSGISYENHFQYSQYSRDDNIADYCDPMIIPLLSTESLDIILDGMPYSRTEKTAQIVNYEPVRRFLNVCISCIDTWKNCSTCRKCCRTLMTLESLGKLDDFRDLFDIEKYKKQAKLDYICLQFHLIGKDYYADDNINLARRNHIKLPSRLARFLYRARKGSLRRIKKLLRK
ncbi:MAG: hypothetical protein ACYSUT_01250 [Planctomycetota bacterium]